MIYYLKSISIKFILLLLCSISINNSLLFSQCTTASPTTGVFPATVSGVTITMTPTGNVTTFAGTYTSGCGMPVGPTDLWLISSGGVDFATVTFDFSCPVNNVVIFMNAATATYFPPEEYTFTVNAGVLTSTVAAAPYCDLLQTGNTFTAIGGDGSAIITLTSTIPYTSITISGTGTNDNNGALFTICNTSITSCDSISASNSGPYCEGEDINLSATAGGSDYDWTGPGGYSMPNTQNPTITGATAAMSGTYTVTVTTPSGIQVLTTDVVVNPLPNVNASNTGPYCEGQTINLNSTGGGSYSWAGPGGYTSLIQNPTITNSTIANAGTYTVTVTDANGCIGTNNTDIIINTSPTIIASNTGPYCVGDTIRFSSTIGDNYLWSGPNGFTSISQNNIISNASSMNNGVYTVTTTNLNGCSASATTLIQINANPNSLPFYSPQEPTLGSGVNFSNSSCCNIASWIWNIDGNTIFNSDHFYSFDQPGSYNGSLIVINDFGCADTQTFTIIITEETSIYIPNTFTPNGDGLNDIFFIYGRSIKSMELKIFNRWGQELFTSNDQAKGWNGKTNNNSIDAPQGVYAYTIYYKDFLGEEYELTGQVNLIR